MLGADPKSESVGIPPVLFRVFVAGSAGNADVGGPYDGLEGLGKAAILIPVLVRLLLEYRPDKFIRSFATFANSSEKVDPSCP